MTEPSVMAMDLEGLPSSLPADEGFKLCAELMGDYLAVLSSEDKFKLKLDCVLLAWNVLRNEPLLYLQNSWKCTFDLRDVSD